MKNVILYLLFAIMISGCSHKIVRTEYDIDKSDYKDCKIVIQKNVHISDSLRKIGEIKVGDSGFALSCSEAHAIEILKNEGCALNADIVNITEENRPDLLSTCYRCKAEFYNYTISDVIAQTDEFYNPENVNKRVSKDRTRNSFNFIGTVILLTVLGFLLIQ